MKINWRQRKKKSLEQKPFFFFDKNENHKLLGSWRNFDINIQFADSMERNTFYKRQRSATVSFTLFKTSLSNNIYYSFFEEKTFSGSLSLYVHTNPVYTSCFFNVVWTSFQRYSIEKMLKQRWKNVLSLLGNDSIVFQRDRIKMRFDYLRCVKCVAIVSDKALLNFLKLHSTATRLGEIPLSFEGSPAKFHQKIHILISSMDFFFWLNIKVLCLQ